MTTQVTIISGLSQGARHLFFLSLQFTTVAWGNASLAFSNLTSCFHSLWVEGSVNPNQLAFHFLQLSLYIAWVNPACSYICLWPELLRHFGDFLSSFKTIFLIALDKFSESLCSQPSKSCQRWVVTRGPMEQALFRLCKMESQTGNAQVNRPIPFFLSSLAKSYMAFLDQHVACLEDP